ncbi:hypothetical protein ATANTOWER_006764, partial [Ataeniobius toweri]|nr:hypothetical protein [Ataeniobius toweri]
MPERDIFSIRMPPVVRVNVVFLGQRCADELILGMSRGAWRQQARVHERFLKMVHPTIQIQMEMSYGNKTSCWKKAARE